MHFCVSNGGGATVSAVGCLRPHFQGCVWGEGGNVGVVLGLGVAGLVEGLKEGDHGLGFGWGEGWGGGDGVGHC